MYSYLEHLPILNLHGCTLFRGTFHMENDPSLRKGLVALTSAFDLSELLVYHAVSGAGAVSARETQETTHKRNK